MSPGGISTPLKEPITAEVTAVLLEPVQGEGGPGRPGDEYFRGCAGCATRAASCSFVDEVQAGLGRTGRWWGFELYGVQPDVVTVANALGNGVPSGPARARDNGASRFQPGRPRSTFGGRPLAAAAARATLAVMEELDAPRLAKARGGLLSEKVDGARAGVRSIRGLGLLLAVELASAKPAGWFPPAACNRAWCSTR